MAPHSSTLAWKIPWTGEPAGLQSMGSLRVGHDWATSLSHFHFHALEKETATHSSVLAWRIPGAGESGGLTSMGSHRVGHDWSDLAAAAGVLSDFERRLVMPESGNHCLFWPYPVVNTIRAWNWIEDCSETKTSFSKTVNCITWVMTLNKTNRFIDF